jgi:hypothetical protein
MTLKILSVSRNSSPSCSRISVPSAGADLRYLLMTLDP